MTSLIIGYGEVGKGLFYALDDDTPRVYDPSAKYEEERTEPSGHYDIVHICFPYSERFEDLVRAYQEKLTPKYTIIHSTVPVGTSARLGAVHSPIRGIHPHMESGIRTFVKFLGGPQAGEVADYFRKNGIKIMLCEKSETTELMKLLDTEYYRTCVEFTHKAKELCDKFDVPFSEAYTLANITYNEGYTKLDHPEYVRPVLQPIKGPIGGHCLMPNKKILEDLCEK